jgi:hypothetical protein
MKPQILLINPYIHDFTAYDLWMKPLGLYWIAAYLENHGYAVSMVDCLDRYNTVCLHSQGLKKPKGTHNGCGPLPFTLIPKPPVYKRVLRRYRRFGIPRELFQELLQNVPAPQAILVGSMMTYWYPGVFETIGLLKEKFPRVPIALGGVYATLCPEHAKSFSGADMVFTGPSEVKVLKWLDQITGQERQYPPYDIVPVELLPMPAHHFLFPYSPAVIASSLGCPLRCTYCASYGLQPCFRQRPVENVVAEIEYLARKKHIRHIAFYDDALLFHAQIHIIPILKTVIDKSLPVCLHTPNGIHSYLMTGELANLLKKANVETVRLSYERSFDADSTLEDKELEKAIAYLQEAGYGRKPKIEVYVKIGLPDQTLEQIVEGFMFVHRLGAHIRLADYSPVPGTPDFKKTMEKYGLDGSEPLYHNKTALPYFTASPEPGILQDLKSLVGTLNFTLEHGISLTNHSKIAGLFLHAAKAVEREMEKL